MTKKSDLIDAPIFLVGAERSGTTLLRLMLDHHPQIAFSYEFEYSVDWVSDAGEWPPLDHYHEELETDRIFQDTGFTIDPNLNYPELMNSFLVQKKERDNKSIVGATVHRHFDRLLWIWPNARFIHIIRDARDVARSCISMGWAGNVWTGVTRWLEAEEIWESLLEKVPTERRIEIRYEDLISDVVGTLTKICNFVGTPYDPAMLSYTETTSYDVPNPSLVQQWKTKLSEQEIRLVEAQAGHLIEKRGYQLSGLPTLEMNVLMKNQLKLQDWSFRLQKRIKRFGFNLVLFDFLSRRLHFKEWQKEIKLKLNKIELDYLK